MRLLYETEKAYLAGIIDGEGCISIGMRPTRGRFAPYVSICSVDKRLHSWIRERIPLAKTQKGTLASSHRNTTYYTFFYPSLIREIFPQILVYLVLKRDQANIMLEFLNLRKFRPKIPEEDLVKMYDLANQLSKLHQMNGKGKRGAPRRYT